MSTNDTEFAPAERADTESILRDAKALKKAGLIEHVIHVIPSIVMVLNRNRQIVFNNQRVMSLLAIASDQDILGRRPGELFNCIHANEGAAGCGTTKFCRKCGAVKAILQSHEQEMGVETECRISTTSCEAYEFRVWATPYSLNDTDYTIFILQDISDEKRREVLEHTFFHDMNNILQLIFSHSEHAQFARNKEDLVKSLKNIQLTVRQLAVEISSQMRLLQAEKGDLTVEIERCDSAASLVNDVVCAFTYAKPDRLIAIGKECDDFGISTDRRLLNRVLYNMVKNAIEASSPAEVVSICYKQEKSSGVFSVHNSGFIPLSTQLQVFQRSFSTKGKGRGLGTYSMKLFGEKYLRGKVWFSTSEGKGTTFFISVPLSYKDITSSQQGMIDA